MKNQDFYTIYSQHVKAPSKEDVIADKKRVFDNLNGRQKKFIHALDRILMSYKFDSVNLIYLDYGCNDGMFTYAVAKHFNIRAENVWAVDILEETPYIIKNAGFNYVRLDLSDVSGSLAKLPKCNFVTIINVTHHIPIDDREGLLKLLDHHISSKSPIVIKEHECKSTICIYDVIARKFKE